MGRAISQFEYALNYEIDAINECLSAGQLDVERLRTLYANAARYAEACGRHRKAASLGAELRELADETSDVTSHP